MSFTDDKLLQEFNKLIDNNKYDSDFVVDIGASMNSFFTDYDYDGVLFDMDAKKLNRISNDNLYKKAVEKVTPDNVTSLLEKYNTPKDFLALNLDIDGYDLFVLINLLKQYSPEIIITEINEKIPPPIKFSVTYDKDYKWNVDHFYGYSLSCLEPVLKHFGYHIHKLVYNNVILTKGSYSEMDIDSHYEEGYYVADQREKVFSHNSNVEYWQQLNPEELRKEINRSFTKYQGKYTIGKDCETLIKKLCLII